MRWASEITRRARQRLALERVRRVPRGVLSDVWGVDRGTPVDRIFIEGFLADHAADVRGVVLEVNDPRYIRRFGAGRVTEEHVLDVNPANPQATIVGDLADPSTLAPLRGRCDCIVITQVLQYVGDLAQGFANLYEALSPGGVVLITVPCLARADPYDIEGDRWRFMPPALEYLVRRACPQAEAEVCGRGNLRASMALLYGLAAEELPAGVLGEHDRSFPTVACARIRRPQPASTT